MNLPLSEAQTSDELCAEELEAVAGGGVFGVIALGAISAGGAMIAGVISGKSARETLGDAVNSGISGAIAGAFIPEP